jgi:hypothetical protein
MKKDIIATKWSKVLDSKKEEPFFSKWGATDERILTKLTNQSITLAEQTMKNEKNNVITMIHGKQEKI